MQIWLLWYIIIAFLFGTKYSRLSNMTFYCIKAECKSKCEPMKDTTHLNLTAIRWGVFCEIVHEKWPRCKVTSLYIWFFWNIDSMRITFIGYICFGTGGRNWYQVWGHGCDTTESQMSPQPRRSRGCGDIWESVVSQPWPKTRYQFLFYHGTTKLTLN